jgi:hypothetical protein
MKNVTRNARYWLGGSLLAVAGVLLARVFGPHATSPLRLPLTLGGQLLALSGLFLICVGVSRRLKRDAANPS